MSAICIVVVDAKCARFFSVEPGAAPGDRMKLAERSMLLNPAADGAREGGAERVKTEGASNRQAGDAHPIAARRQQHRLEPDRRFGREIARQTSEIVNASGAGTVVLIAAPRLLGLMREKVRDVLGPAIELKELAKDYGRLTPDELHDLLALKHLMPARRIAPV